MTLQDAVWTIALVGMGLVALGFFYVISQARKPADDVTGGSSARSGNTLRRWVFWILVVGYIGGSWATLHRYPIPNQHGSLDAAQVVDVSAHMWYWQIKPTTIQTGSSVEFRVTSGDVNHGFGLYAPDGHIVIQTQAMPGYTNKLLYTFTEPGTYTVQCLEYCGVGHAPMRTTLKVVAPGGN